jgi:hypothetical protein
VHTFHHENWGRVLAIRQPEEAKMLCANRAQFGGEGAAIGRATALTPSTATSVEIARQDWRIIDFVFSQIIKAGRER